MKTRCCVSCAATEADGASFPDRLPRYKRGKPKCQACLDQERRQAEVEFHVHRQHLISRASYRAKLRVRAASPQADLVDLIVRRP